MREKCIDPISNIGKLQPAIFQAALLDCPAVIIFNNTVLCLPGESVRSIEPQGTVFIDDLHKIIRFSQKWHRELLV
ncbi:hypothetical protein D3C80_2096900 [compost metagenome]